MADQVRIGIIGAGLVTDLHWSGYQNLLDRFDLVAVADVVKEKAEAQAAKFGARKVYTDHRDLFADDEIQAVDICLPHHLHCTVATHAAKFQKHIFCEKPMATSLPECDWMIEAAREHGVVLMIGENFRFFPSVRKAKELIAQGVIGAPQFMQGYYGTMLGGKWVTTPWRFEAKESGGGPFLDGGVHFVDVMVNIMGMPRSVHCYWKSIRPQFTTEDLCVVSVDYASGALGQITSSASFPESDAFGWEVMGTTGKIRILNSSALELTTGEFAGDPPTWQSSPKQRIDCDATNSFQLELAHFADCIQHGATCEMPGAEGRHDVEFVLACYESARKGERVRLPL